LFEEINSFEESKRDREKDVEKDDKKIRTNETISLFFFDY